ncbi:MAG: HipA domain-containing protein [Treponema sp.]|nr:HipA domain-containing protein [Treponema sp.]MCL2273029.1 HipA domain-containing protein [Treponema sp.]
MSNTYDHLRNHGFLFNFSSDNNFPKGWRLSPVYDLNPVPRQTGQPFLSLAIDMVSHEALLKNAFSVISEFKKKALVILDEVQRAVSSW